MRLLAIETSCDETGLAVFSFEDSAPVEAQQKLTLEAHVLFSQVALHAQFGGVFPALAKRAHAERFVPLLEEVLQSAGLRATASSKSDKTDISPESTAFIETLREKDPDLIKSLLEFFATTGKPDIDYIAVTSGPGLEPALWVGVNAARILSCVWEIPLLPINHMEGHVVTAFFQRQENVQEKNQEKNTEENTAQVFVRREFTFPVLALLVSGGHTELVLSDAPGVYKKIGATRDDAVGEAFDKVARVLGLPYPGGPKISALAKEFRAKQQANAITNAAAVHQPIDQPFVFPRPMQHSGDFDFSYSGLKTAVLYTVQKLQKEMQATGDTITVLTEEHKLVLAAAFEDAAIEVLVHKVKKAIEHFHPKTFLIGGGVAGNEHLQNELTRTFSTQALDGSLAQDHDLQFLIPERQFTTDNAVMIGLAAFLKVQNNPKTFSVSDLDIKAEGNLSIGGK